MGGGEVRGMEERRREITDIVEQREYREGQRLYAIKHVVLERAIF